MSRQPAPIEIDPSEYQGWRQAPEAHPHYLLDIREPWEHRMAHLSGDRLIPIDEVPARIGEIPRDEDIVIYCHHGVRSFQVAYYLRQHGFDRARSLRGGIARWSAEFDTSIPQY